MNNTHEKTTYISQFRIDTNINLPCNFNIPQPYNDYKEVLTINFKKDLTNGLNQVHWEGRKSNDLIRSYNTGNALLVCALDSINILIANDASIINVEYDEDNNMESSQASAIVSNLGISICSLLKGYLPIHSCSISFSGKQCAIMAPSGTGKSTLLWSLIENGAVLFNDDVTVLSVNDRKIIAYPSLSLHSRLNLSKVDRYNILINRYNSFDKLLPIYPGSDHYWIPIHYKDRITSPASLGALFVLRPSKNPPYEHYAEVKRIYGGEIISTLMSNTQGLWALRSILKPENIFKQYISIARTIPVFELHYNRSFTILPKLIELVEDCLLQRS